MVSRAPSTNIARDPAEADLRQRVKRELRKRAQGVRKATPTDACRLRSLAIVERLEALPAVREARRVALFWPILDRHEVDLRTFDASLRSRGVRVAYPAIVAPRDDEAPGIPNRMVFRFVSDPAALEERGFGFAEPPLDAETVSSDLHDLDLVVVPALAIDPTGHRLGYGAGYYDAALAETAVATVGVVFDFQLISEVPTTVGDVAVDWIVSDARVLRAEPVG